jgi:hypothetical protein
MYKKQSRLADDGKYEEERRQVHSSKHATVEVTVKVKKRRSPNRKERGDREGSAQEVYLPDRKFPKGN